MKCFDLTQSKRQPNLNRCMMKRKFGDFLRSSTTLYKHLYQAELQNLGISTYLYTEMLIRPVYG